MALSGDLAKQRRALTKAWLRWRLPLVGAAVALAVLGGAWFGWEQYRLGAAEEESRAREAAVREVGTRVSAALAARLDPLAADLDLPRLAGLVAAGDPAAIAAEEGAIASAREGVLRVRLLPAGVRRTDYTTQPPLSYASLDLLRRSEEKGEAEPPEVHLFGDDAQHVAVVRRLEGASGELVGHALLAVDVGLLAGTLAGAESPGLYLELQQPVAKGKPLVLARAGDRGLGGGSPAARLRVKGTAWQAVVWDRSSGGAASAARSGELPLPLLGGAAALVLIAGAAVVVVRRRARVEVDEGAEEPDQPAVTAEPGSTTGTADGAVAGSAPGAGEGGDAVAPAPCAPARRIELPASIFRAYDVRGIFGKTLTADVVRSIGQAIGSEAYDRGQQTIVVGRDGRASSPELAEALIEGLRATGRDAIDIGCVPTPVLYFATHYLNTGSGVMVTGSHNPANYNGLKIMLAGDTLFGDDIQRLRARIEGGELASGEGGLQHMEVVDEYIRRVTEDVPVALGNAFKVVVDCGNGVAGDVAPKLYRALGHDVVELYCEVDGSFPNHHPDPSQPENLADLIGAVKEHGADIGLAFDGDGDRLGVVDPEGRILWPDLQMMLFARDVLSRNAGAEIVFDVKCTAFLPKVIQKLGGKPVMWKTGHSFIKNKLKESGAPLAGEMSGHIFFQDRWYGFDDAIYAGARLLEILMALDASPAETFARLPSGVATPELRLDVAEGRQLELMSTLKAGADFGEGRITDIDGLRVDYKDGWGLVRASNTTPSLVLRFESSSEEGLERIKDRFREALLAADDGLKLPF